MINEIYKFQERVLKCKFPAEAKMLDEEQLGFAHEVLSEEVFELMIAEDFNEQVDAILDVIYFAMGRLYEMGIPPTVAMGYFDSVHKANMAKILGMTKRGIADDAAKPEGWQPPFHDIGECSGS